MLGISGSQVDFDCISYYLCGFEIDNYMVDGILMYFEFCWNLGDVLMDIVLYECVEVVCGVNGLMIGIGNFFVLINMICKYVISWEFKGNVFIEYGSWNKQCYVMDL